MQVSFVGHDWTEDQPVFASPAYLEALAASNPAIERFGWIGGRTGGQVRFVLPYIQQRNRIFRFVQFQAATVCIEPAAELSEENDFLNAVADFLRASGIDFIVQPTVNALFRTYPDGAIHAPYGTFALDLSLSEQALWNAMEARHRQSVKSAIKAKVEIRQDPGHLGEAHRLIGESLERSGQTGYEPESFTRLISGLGPHVRIFTAWKEGRCEGSAVIPFSRWAASYLYGGRAADAHQGAHHLLHWEAIRAFKAMGVARYDFHGARLNPAPGSKQEGIQRFKVRFGSRLETGYLWKLPLRPLKHLAYQKALSVRSWMRGGAVSADIIDQEIARARGA